MRRQVELLGYSSRSYFLPHRAQKEAYMPHVSPSSNEIAINRIYDASVKSVWNAWVVSAQVSAWWGPRGFTITSHAKDVRIGGTWAYTMHGPDGVNYENKTVFLEVEEGVRMLYDHGGNDDRPPLFRVDVRFSEVGRRTHMDMRMILPSAEAAAQTRGYIQQANGNTTWDRLAEYLHATLRKKECFVINRTFHAPIARMFEIWTDTGHLAKWVSPTGTGVEFIKADVRVGGRTFSRMSGPNDNPMYGAVEYLELTRPSRVVYTQQFRTADDTLARHPLAPTWPETMHTIVELSEEGPADTRVTLTWEPDGANTVETIATFTGARAGMTQGWTGSFDQLERYLAQLG
jgi:uncharacterized protein YndB with AHSA1/START domain